MMAVSQIFILNMFTIGFYPPIGAQKFLVSCTSSELLPLANPKHFVLCSVSHMGPGTKVSSPDPSSGPELSVFASLVPFALLCVSRRL